jgi:hypothetical protein
MTFARGNGPTPWLINQMSHVVISWRQLRFLTGWRPLGLPASLGQRGDRDENLPVRVVTYQNMRLQDVVEGQDYSFPREVSQWCELVICI